MQEFVERLQCCLQLSFRDADSEGLFNDTDFPVLIYKRSECRNSTLTYGWIAAEEEEAEDATGSWSLDPFWIFLIIAFVFALFAVSGWWLLVYKGSVDCWYVAFSHLVCAHSNTYGYLCCLI